MRPWMYIHVRVKEFKVTLYDGYALATILFLVAIIVELVIIVDAVI